MTTLELDGRGGTSEGDRLRLLLLVRGGRDRELFAGQLDDEYEVLPGEPSEEWPAFDLCLVDAAWYPEVAAELAAHRSAAEPAQLPVLLLVDDRLDDHPWIADALGDTVDDVVELPTSREELDARVASFARIRAMSTELAAQRDRLRLFRRAIDEASVGISITDAGQPDDPLVYVNDRFTELTGYGAAAALGRTFRVLQGPDTEQESIAELRRAVDEGEATRVELTSYRTDGTPFRNRVTLAPVHDPAGELTHFVCFHEDVTAERERERRYEAILDNADQFAGLLEPDGTLVEANAAALAAIDADREAVVGRQFRETAWFDAESRPVVEDAIERAAAGELVRGELDLTLGGTDRTIAFTLKPVTDANETVALLLAEGRDITELKRREDELREERAFAESIFERLPDVLYAFDQEGNFLRWNDRLCEVTGYTDEEVAGMHPLEFIPEDDRERIAKNVAAVVGSGEMVTTESAFETKAGERIPYEFTGAPLVARDDTELGLVGIGRDISERKSRKRELERFEAMLQAAPDPVYALDTSGRFTLVNDAMVEALGYDRETLVGSHVSLVMPASDVETGQELVAGLRESGAAYDTLETRATTAEGEVRVFEINITLLTDDAGGMLGTVGVCRDVTALRQNERRLSVFDRVLRHNLRNKMNIVIARADAIATGLDDPAAQADAIRAASEELLALSEQARTFHSSVAPEAESAPTDVAAVARRIVADHREQHADCSLSVDCVDTAWARAHETLELALDELVENAIVHSDRETPWVEVRVEPAGDQVTVAVADDGPGMDDLDRAAVQRGHETPLDHAQGLGLWFVRWTATNSGGGIAIHDRDPCGTVVELTLPATDPPSAAPGDD